MNGPIAPFTLARVPALRFGLGRAEEAGEYAAEKGYRRLALVTGERSYQELPIAPGLEGGLKKSGIAFRRFIARGEPTAALVDGIRDELRSGNFSAVLAVGGGSVIDTGKAVAAMCVHEGSVEEYLEGVGSKKPEGRRLPLIAVPTTAGTGTEATKNAVLRKVGKNGYKKSLRHEAFVPDLAIIDPLAAISLPPALTAASGLDALTQLLEGYVSTGANPLTDALALDGLRRAAKSLPLAVSDGGNRAARADMAYAAYLSGIVLANASLGVVHGLAPVLGSLKEAPHGYLCGRLLAGATERIVERLLDRVAEAADKGAEEEADRALAALKKYYRAACIVTGEEMTEAFPKMIPEKIKERIEGMTRMLRRWVEDFTLSPMSDYGFTEENLLCCAASAGLKGTPVALSAEDIEAIALSSVRA